MDLRKAVALARAAELVIMTIRQAVETYSAEVTEIEEEAAARERHPAGKQSPLRPLRTTSEEDDR